MSTSVSMNDIIQGARVQGALRGAHVTPATGLQICWGDDVPAGTGSSIVIPRLAAIAVPAGTKTEAGEFDLVESSTDGETLTSGWVGYTDRVSDELSYDATEDATVLVVQHGLEWLGNRVDADLMTIGASFPTDSDFTDLALTQSRFLEAQADFKANLPVPGMSAGAFGLQQMADLKADLASNGGSHFGGDVASQQLKELLDLSFGYEGALYGQAVFSSANVVDAGSKVASSRA